MLFETSTAELYDYYVLGNYAGFPLNLTRGRGSRVYDEEGREYLDFCTGLAVCSLGHSHPKLVEALREQAEELIHVSNLYRNRNQALAAKRLVEVVGTPGRVFFSNSGAESNEAAIKLARKFFWVTRPNVEEADAVPEVISFSTSFHGRTLAGIAATGQDKVKLGFGPMPVGFRHVTFNDSEAARSAVNAQTAAFLVEPIQGEGGIHVATPQFLRTLADLCKEHNLLLIFDEVQCGLGRAGDWCCWKALGVPEIQPDVVTWAKGIGGGFPVGAVWISDRRVRSGDHGEIALHALLGPGSHGTTYGGAPLTTAVVLAVLQAIDEEGLLTNVTQRSQQAMTLLKRLNSPLIHEVRGVGLMIGISFHKDRLAQALGIDAKIRSPAAELSARLIEEGLLAPPAGPGVLRWLPPLNVTADEITEAYEKFSNLIRRIS